MAATPDKKNYSIPTGYATFLKTGEMGSPVDLGNIVEFSISNDVQKKDHFKSRGGRRTKDQTTITQVGATIKFTLDEIVAANIAYFALGPVVEHTDGTVTIAGLTDTDFEGTLKIVGDNEVGTQIDWEGVVKFTPAGDFKFIQNNDDYNTIQIEAEVQEDDTLGFGKWTVREQA